MSKQPEALEIAVHPGTSDAARDQLIRQHALIEELREALEACENRLTHLAVASVPGVMAELKIARAALTKSEAQQ
jgi:hypothetical protein